MIDWQEIAAAELPADLVLDGEIVAFDEDGNPSFERLQGRCVRNENGLMLLLR